MREIKFRGWHKIGKEMVEMHQLPLHSKYPKESLLDVFDNLSHNWVLMQYTGLKDKDGVEIYEGDIIKHNHGHWYVSFNVGSYYLYHCEIKNYDNSHLAWGALKRLFDNDMIDIYNQVEVIGNIYENQELMTTTKEKR